MVERPWASVPGGGRASSREGGGALRARTWPAAALGRPIVRERLGELRRSESSAAPRAVSI